MNIPESFAQLISRIQPLQSELDAARQHRDTIQTRLQTEFEVSSCRPIGSSARGTSIRCFSDTDLLALFRKTVFTRGDSLINSDTSLEKVRVALAERYPNSNVYKDGIAIAVSFSDGRHVDLVPAVFDTMFKEKWPVYLIPDGAGGWMGTSPALYDAYLAGANKESGGKLTYVAELMKFWRECREPRIPLPSFHIEMVLAYEDVCKGVKLYSDCMLDILRSLARRECRAMRDPYGIAGNIPAVKTENQRERALASVTNSRNHADSARTAENSGDLQEARKQWDIVFNGRFPW
jgi:hypothetical protein